ncbi:UDP-N-acetylglucosamine 4,6-dehydratase (inverting) [Patescibacteria group bacterium]|nr:UDP-N-acetylglucosamine 4,6-dehydratase (inverting) [Patescibacteria group bacterium]
MEELNNKTVLITGGTGSFGKNFAKFLLKNYQLKKLIIFSRDELKQFQMQKELIDYQETLRFFIGDVRDLQRLQRAFNGVDIIIHAAALKQIPIIEYNPFEAVKTNIIGSQNVINAAIDQKVEKVLLISTDKAAQPINLYGSTKLCAEKLFINGNVYSGGKTKFSCVRYGNVLGSRGSIIETLLNSRDAEEVYITDELMTRFWITLRQSFDLVLFALDKMRGGEVFVPKIPSMKLVDLFEAITPKAKRKVIGIRPGEKLHEILLTEEESRHSLELDKYYVILPEGGDYNVDAQFESHIKAGKELPQGFCLISHSNIEWLTNEDLIKLIEE